MTVRLGQVGGGFSAPADTTFPFAGVLTAVKTDDLNRDGRADLVFAFRDGEQNRSGAFLLRQPNGSSPPRFRSSRTSDRLT